MGHLFQVSGWEPARKYGTRRRKKIKNKKQTKIKEEREKMDKTVREPVWTLVGGTKGMA